MMKRLCLMAALIALLAPAGARASGVLDFGLAGGGTVSYGGGALSPLVGLNIAIDQVCGINTPINDGVCFDVTDGVLSFTTGAFSSYDASDWYFDGGGSISITGTIVALAISGELMGGTWTDATVMAQGDGRAIVTGDYSDVKNDALAAYFGLPSTGWTGTLNPSVAYVGNPPAKFSATAMAGDVINSSAVPEPASLGLFCTGLLAVIGGWRRRVS